jgi:hypothetical protein
MRHLRVTGFVQIAALLLLPMVFEPTAQGSLSVRSLALIHRQSAWRNNIVARDIAAAAD